jgi:uncharacterized membrane protein affecting hemolysin expression
MELTDNQSYLLLGLAIVIAIILTVQQVRRIPRG